MSEKTAIAALIHPFQWKINPDMPVYKITEKRMQRKEKAEKEKKQFAAAVKALQRAEGEDDGEEGSGSEGQDGESDGSDDEDEDEDEEDEEDDAESVGTMDSEDDSSEDGEDDDDDEEAEDDDAADAEGPEGEDEEGSDEDMLEDTFDKTIDQVASDPIYPLPTPPYPASSSSCTVCPGRLFKNEHMEKEHIVSRFHKRAMRRWEARLVEAQEGGRELESEDPRVVVEGILDRLEAERGGEGDTEATPLTKPAATKTGASSSSSKKRKLSKKERRVAKAQAQLAAAGTAHTAPDEAKDGAGSKRKRAEDAEGSAESDKAPKMNRQARRLAAKMAGTVSVKPSGAKKETEGKSEAGSKPSTASAPVTVQAETPKAAKADGTSQGSVAGENRRERRKRLSEAKAAA